MIFDATKVTYNMYSCKISGMSRKIMKMDGRDSAECQNWENRDKIGIKGIDLSHKKTKNATMLISSNSKEAKTWGSRIFDAVAEMEVFVEREGLTSL